MMVVTVREKIDDDSEESWWLKMRLVETVDWDGEDSEKERWWK